MVAYAVCLGAKFSSSIFLGFARASGVVHHDLGGEGRGFVEGLGDACLCSRHRAGGGGRRGSSSAVWVAYVSRGLCSLFRAPGSLRRRRGDRGRAWLFGVRMDLRL